MNQQNPDLATLLSQDTDANMQEYFNEPEKFYAGLSVVAAKPVEVPHQGTEHAEYRVLKHIESKWMNDHTNNFLLVYTYLSPCVHKCANPSSSRTIVESIGVMASWKGYALVFQKPYSHPKDFAPVSEAELKTALSELAQTIGYTNILRCYKPAIGAFRCVTCFSGPQNTVVDECIDLQSGASSSS